MHGHFTRFARAVSDAAGYYVTFDGALLVVVIWALSGLFFRFSQVWRLAISTGATIITFLMVFLIQNTRMRDSRAIHLKLDELINLLKAADHALIPAEDAPMRTSASARPGTNSSPRKREAEGGTDGQSTRRELRIFGEISRLRNVAHFLPRPSRERSQVGGQVVRVARAGQRPPFRPW